MIQPVLVGFLIEYFLPNSKVSTDRAYLYVVILILTYFVISWTEVASNYEKQIFGARFRISLTGLVYKKVCVFQLLYLVNTNIKLRCRVYQ